MLKNLNKTGGLIFSQEVLLALIKKGATREDAYAMVQRNAMQVWEEQLDFKTLLKGDSEIMSLLDENEIMQFLKKNIHNNDIILIKGSNSTKVNKLANMLNANKE